MSDSSTPPTTAALFLRWLPILAFSAVIAHHFWFVNSHAPNIPYQDDVLDLLHFVSLVESTAGADSQFQEWFRQYVDHRTIASRLQVYGAYLVQGEVNFHSLSLLTNLALPLILLLFYLRVREEEERWILLLASALLLLHLRFFSLIVWSQAAFAYYYVFFYAFACLFALHKVTPAKFALAAVLCTLSSFTYAAGQIVWALGFASLVHQWFVTGRRPFLYPATWASSPLISRLAHRPATFSGAGALRGLVSGDPGLCVYWFQHAGGGNCRICHAGFLVVCHDQVLQG